MKHRQGLFVQPGPTGRENITGGYPSGEPGLVDLDLARGGGRGDTVELTKDSVVGDELLERTVLRNLPVIDDENSIGPTDRAQAVGDDEHGTVSGEIVEVNEELEDDASLINSSPYGDGWIVKIKMTDPGELEKLAKGGEAISKWIFSELERVANK